MVQVSLECAIIGLTGTQTFDVTIDAGKKVSVLKDAIMEKNATTLKCDVSLLHLFLAKGPDGKWLNRAGVAAVTVDKAREVPVIVDEHRKRHELKEMDPSLFINNSKHMGVEFKPAEGQVHVLVQMPILDRVSCTWELFNKTCPALEMGNSSLVRISTAYTLGSGVAANQEKDLLLYLRSQLVEEWQSIETFVCKSFAELWIVGPPGTGKSCAAFALACSLDRADWDIVWIHCPKRGVGLLQCILFRGATEKWTCNISPTELASVLQRLEERTVLFVDGYTKKKTNGALIETACVEWRERSKEHHRLVWVSSMATLGKDNHQAESAIILSTVDASPLKTAAIFPRPASQEKLKDEMLFEVMSWALEDYEMAMANNEFFEHVKTNFTDSKDAVLSEERNQLLADKFFVAGGSARYMFDFTVDGAVAELDKAIAATDDIKGYIEGTRGISSEGAVNRLFSWYRAGGDVASCLVSKHVARKLAQKLGPDFVQNISTSLSSNPSLDGHLYELWFFAKLSHGGVECHKIGDDGATFLHDTWKAEKVPYFDPNDTIPLDQAKQWLAPRMWNQGGYDAVYVEIVDNAGAPKVQVRFVQVTRADKHSFKDHFFATLLCKLIGSFPSHQFEAVEVYFVVPIWKLSTFKPKVDTLQVQKHVLEVAGLRAETTIVAVEVVGLNYKEFRECDDLKRLETKRFKSE
jgi:hypothetical protein